MDKAIELFRANIDKIKNYKTVSSKDKVDKLLFIDATQYTNLGTESTKTERHTAEVNSRYIYRAIKQLDKRTGELLLRANEQ